MEDYVCPDACHVQSYSGGLSYTTLSDHSVQNILQDDLTEIQSEYHNALELMNRVEIESFEEIVDKFGAVQTSINLFKRDIQLIGEFDLKIILDGIKALAEFALQDIIGINKTFTQYYIAYFEPGKNQNLTNSYSNYFSEHSSIALEMEQLREIQVNLDYLSQMIFNMNYTIKKGSFVHSDIKGRIISSLRRYLHMIKQKTLDVTCKLDHYLPCSLYPKLKSDESNKCKYMLEGRLVISKVLEDITEGLDVILSDEGNNNTVSFPQYLMQQLINSSLNVHLASICLARYSTQLQNAMDRIRHITAGLNEYVENSGDLSHIIGLEFEEEIKEIVKLDATIIRWKDRYMHMLKPLSPSALV